MLLKEAVDAPQIIGRICNILIPREFTRLDDIIEIVFFTTEEAKQETALIEGEEFDSDLDLREKPKKADAPVAFHEACIERFVSWKNIILVKRSRSSYSTPDNKTAVICSVSKSHKRQAHTSYWFGFHLYQKDFLEKAAAGFLVLGCGSKNNILAIPFSELSTWLDDLWTTEREGSMYWHLRIHVEGSKMRLDRKKGKGRLDVIRFRLPVAKPE